MIFSIKEISILKELDSLKLPQISISSYSKFKKLTPEKINNLQSSKIIS